MNDSSGEMLNLQKNRMGNQLEIFMKFYGEWRELAVIFRPGESSPYLNKIQRTQIERRLSLLPAHLEPETGNVPGYIDPRSGDGVIFCCNWRIFSEPVPGWAAGSIARKGGEHHRLNRWC